MKDRREFLAPGRELILGGVRYEIEGVEGWGGSAVVYRASYEDGLNQGCRHNVFIKELFPYDEKGGIYRDREGRICCGEDRRQWLERCRQSFYQGNRANLELLRKAPEKVSGNVNSFEAYGTFYSVLAIHGGNNLERIVELGSAEKTLKWTALVMVKVLDALACFHENGLLHLDISPDNILLLPERAMLIDYNSVWDRGTADGGFCYLSEKAGYSAPEVRLRTFSEIGPATDLYSVCAVWFFMATGRRLSEEEIVGNGLIRCFPKTLEIFKGEPESACFKFIQIMKKGLHVLARKRYGSVTELLGEVEELLLRIDGKGISHGAAWENSCRRFKVYKGGGERYLKRHIRMAHGDKNGDQSQVLTQEQCKRKLESGGLLLLSGPGGMGKTSFLTQMWGDGIKSYGPSKPVVMYVPLADYQETREKNFYIRDYLARRLFLLDDHGLDVVEKVLDQERGWTLLLLLDGLNEAGPGRGGLVKEIEELGKKPEIGILVTDRSDSVKKYGLYDFSTAELLPLTESAVEGELVAKGIDRKECKGLMAMLTNPMMLVLYEKTMEMALESGRKVEENRFSDTDNMPDTLIGLYLDGLWEKEQRLAAGDEDRQLRCGYLIYHLLPEIAAEMRTRKKTVLTMNEVSRLTDRSYAALSQKAFCRAFPEYRGRSRVMLADIKDGSEWFDYGVTEQLWERLNLVTKSENGNYGLVHDNFLDYLAAAGLANRKKVGVYVKRERGMKAGAAAILGTVMVLGSGWAVRRWESVRRLESGYVAQTTPELREALKQMALNVGALGMQLDMQKQILEEAGKREVLEGDEKALAIFLNFSGQKQDMAAGYVFGRDEGERWLSRIREAEPDFPWETLESLYGRSYAMDEIAAGSLEHLNERLGRKAVPYSDKEKMVRVYERYLEVYGEVACREMNLVMSCVEQDAAEEVWEAVEMTAVFSGYIRQFPYEGESREELERYLRTAKEDLKNCVREMKALGFGIITEEGNGDKDETFTG